MPVADRASLVWQGIRWRVQALPLTLARHLEQEGTGATIRPIFRKSPQSVEIIQQAGCLFTPPQGGKSLAINVGLTVRSWQGLEPDF